MKQKHNHRNGDRLVVARSKGWSKGRREVGVAINDNIKDLCIHGNVLNLDCSMSTSWLCYYTIVLQDISIGGEWVRGSLHIMGLLNSFTTSCE